MFVSHLSLHNPTFLFLAFFAFFSAACTPPAQLRSPSRPAAQHTQTPENTPTHAHSTALSSPALGRAHTSPSRFLLEACHLNASSKAVPSQDPTQRSSPNIAKNTVCTATAIRLRRHACALLTVHTVSARQQRWTALLGRLGRHAACLSKPTLLAYRHLLEVEGDRDRNRYPTFPEALSLRIIRTIVRLDLHSRTQHPHPVRSALRNATQHTQHKHPHDPLVWGHVYRIDTPASSAPSASSASSAPKGDATDADTRPALVFTERDLERFREPTSFLRWPARGAISSGFGLRSDPFLRKQRFHAGLDIVAPFGSPVFAAAQGVVLAAGWMGSCGMGVLLQHDRGYRTLYCHLSQILATPKDPVSSGQRIGSIGSTGRSTGPHLHFGLFLHKHPINPRPYLPRRP